MYTLVPEVFLFLIFPRVREPQSGECESRRGDNEKPLARLFKARLS